MLLWWKDSSENASISAFENNGRVYILCKVRKIGKFLEKTGKLLEKTSLLLVYHTPYCILLLYHKPYCILLVYHKPYCISSYNHNKFGYSFHLCALCFIVRPIPKTNSSKFWFLFSYKVTIWVEYLIKFIIYFYYSY